MTKRKVFQDSVVPLPDKPSLTKKGLWLMQHNPLSKTPAFRDIVTGNNGAFNAKNGYDMVTGIGVPDVKELISRL